MIERTRVSQQLPDGPTDVGRSHQMFAHQDRVYAGLFEQHRIFPAVNPALADDTADRAGFCCFRRIVCCRSVWNVRKSRLLIPTSRAPASSTRGRFSASYNSTKRRHLQVDDGVVQPRSSSPGRHSAISSTASAPATTCFEHLVGIQDEVLAQHRESHGLAYRLQDIEPTLKELSRRSGHSSRQHRFPGTAGRFPAARKSARITPLDGLAFLISAIRRIGPGAEPQRADAANPAPVGTSANCARSSADSSDCSAEFRRGDSLCGLAVSQHGLYLVDDQSVA